MILPSSLKKQSSHFGTVPPGKKLEILFTWIYPTTDSPDLINCSKVFKIFRRGTFCSRIFRRGTFEDARPPKAERSATPPQLSGERRGAASGSFGGAVQNTVIHFRRRGAASGSFGGAVQNIVVRFRRPKHLFHMGRG